MSVAAASDLRRELQHVEARVLGRHADELGQAAGVDARARGRSRTACAGRRGRAAHVMHGTWWCTNTRAPTANGAPGPAATTSPAGSWPSTTGARGSWYQAIRSLPHSPQARTRTTSSPGPATGSGRS